MPEQVSLVYGMEWGNQTLLREYPKVGVGDYQINLSCRNEPLDQKDTLIYVTPIF